MVTNVPPPPRDGPPIAGCLGASIVLAVAIAAAAALLALMVWVCNYVIEWPE